MKESGVVIKRSMNTPYLIASANKPAFIESSPTETTVRRTDGRGMIKDFDQTPSHLTHVAPLPPLQRSLFSDPLINAARKIAFGSEDVRVQVDRLREIEKDIARCEQNKPKGRIELSFGILTPEQNKIVFGKSRMV